MTKGEVATLSFKILSIFAIIHAFDKSYGVAEYVIYGDQMAQDRWIKFLISAGPLLLLVLSGILLWFMAKPLSSSIFNSTAEEKCTNFSLDNIQSIAFSVVGLAILATSLPNLVEMIAVVMFYNTVQGGLTSLMHAFIELLVRIALGVWLLIGSRAIVKFIRQ